jgi:hypothetical protein
MKKGKQLLGVDNPSPPAPQSREEAEEREKSRKVSLKSITDVRRATAWQLHRWPIEKSVIWNRANLHLPRTYLAKDGEDVRVVRGGSDLNQVVHQHYLEQVDATRNTWVNFVHADNVVARRYCLGLSCSLVSSCN